MYADFTRNHDILAGAGAMGRFRMRLSPRSSRKLFGVGKRPLLWLKSLPSLCSVLAYPESRAPSVPPVPEGALLQEARASAAGVPGTTSGHLCGCWTT
jgi:hypothetical protein